MSLDLEKALNDAIDQRSPNSPSLSLKEMKVNFPSPPRGCNVRCTAAGAGPFFAGVALFDADAGAGDIHIFTFCDSD
jgi:hypothetical protein